MKGNINLEWKEELHELYIIIYVIVVIKLNQERHIFPMIETRNALRMAVWKSL
jgi:hypothetical protein